MEMRRKVWIVSVHESMCGCGSAAVEREARPTQTGRGRTLCEGKYKWLYFYWSMYFLIFESVLAFTVLGTTGRHIKIRFIDQQVLVNHGNLAGMLGLNRIF